MDQWDGGVGYALSDEVGNTESLVEGGGNGACSEGQKGGAEPTDSHVAVRKKGVGTEADRARDVEICRDEVFS